MSKSSRPSMKVRPPIDQQGEAETAASSQTGMSTPETAQYISEFAAELSFLAREVRLDLLAYLLDMARLEAIRNLQAKARNP